MRNEKNRGKIYFKLTVLLLCIYIVSLIVYKQNKMNQLPEITIADNKADFLSGHKIYTAWAKKHKEEIRNARKPKVDWTKLS